MHVRILSSVVLPAVALTLLVPVDLPAQNHIVSPAELRSELRSAAAARQRDIAKLEKLLLSDGGRQALASMKLDAGEARKALPLLSDQELARLAAQADRAQADFAASGVSLTNQQVTYIIIGVIVIALVAIIAH
jgi:CHASE3 domain sensor protein